MRTHFLTGAELTPAELGALLDRALELKQAPLASRALAGASVALIFESPRRARGCRSRSACTSSGDTR
jgi:ornithine carbamoyltransferase